MREIKFRYIWQQEETGYLIIKYLTLDDIQSPDTVFLIPKYGLPVIREQYTGLKDKNGRGLTNVYEGDIIDNLGNIKGSIHEVDKRESDLLIPGVGTRAWDLAYKKAVVRGFDFAE